jgi:splicing factor 3B subunit 3
MNAHAVPGGSDGPGGVLVCAENYIYYRNQGHPVVRAALPRRADSSTDRGLLVVAAATHRLRDVFFVLLQSELGDVYKVRTRTGLCESDPGPDR